MTNPDRGASGRDARIHALLQAEALRRQRLSTLSPELRPGDVLAVPMPIQGPELWVVASVDGDRAGLVVADARRFFAPSDPWFDAPSSDMCLRPSARAKVRVAHLLPLRVDHWEGAVQALAGTSAIDPLRVLDADEVAFRAELHRAARVLAGWIEERTLRLSVTDCGAVDGTTSSAEDRRRVASARARFAASTDNAVSRLQRLEQLVGVAARPIELLTDRGIVIMRVHPRAIRFEFTPSADAAVPPPILCVATSGESQPLSWSWEASKGSFVVSLQHDLLRVGFEARIGGEAAFRAMVAAAPDWC